MAEDDGLLRFDILTADHDDLKGGGKYVPLRSRVVLADDYPSYGEAAETAACLAMSVHGTMALSILPVI